MRLLVITANPFLESSPHWRTTLATHGLSAVLLLTERRPRRAWRSLRRNLQRHGILWLPYRAVHLLRDSLRSERAEDPVAVPATVAIQREVVPDLRDPQVEALVRAWAPDLGLSLGAPILREGLFSLPRQGTVNLHLGRVPEYRGAPPAFWELWTDAQEVGATVHRMDRGLDTGPVVAEAVAPLYPRDTLEDASARATELGVIVLRRALDALVAGHTDACPQRAGGRVFRMPTVAQRWALAGRLAIRRARHRLSMRLLVKRGLVAVLLGAVRPIRDLVRTARAAHPIRVFTYHRVTSLCRDGMTLPPEVFQRQMAYLARRHEMVSLERALDAIARGERLRRPFAVVTFDDAYESVFSQAFPVMRPRGIPGTVFVPTALVGTDERFAHDATNPVREHLRVMSWPQLESLQRAGWSLGGHSATHARLAALADDSLERELLEPLAELDRRRPPGSGAPAMAFPFGARGDMTSAQVRRARALGYRAVLSNHGGENRPGRPEMTVRRIDLGGDHAEFAWKAYADGFDLASMAIGSARS